MILNRLHKISEKIELNIQIHLDKILTSNKTMPIMLTSKVKVRKLSQEDEEQRVRNQCESDFRVKIKSRRNMKTLVTRCKCRMILLC